MAKRKDERIRLSLAVSRRITAFAGQHSTNPKLLADKMALYGYELYSTPIGETEKKRKS